MIVTLLACMAHRFVSSNRWTMNASALSCNACMACDCHLNASPLVETMDMAISRTYARGQRRVAPGESNRDEGGPYQSRKRKLQHEQIRGLLVPSDLLQCQCSRFIPPGFAGPLSIAWKRGLHQQGSPLYGAYGIRPSSREGATDHHRSRYFSSSQTCLQRQLTCRRPCHPCLRYRLWKGVLEVSFGQLGGRCLSVAQFAVSGLPSMGAMSSSCRSVGLLQ